MKTQSATKEATTRDGSPSPPMSSGFAATVLHVDDDPNDAALLRAAAVKAQSPFQIQHVEDADHAVAYLNGLGEYADRNRYRLPALVLLDLKMPRTTGLEVLQWIRSHPQLGRIPVVVLSGSELQEDIQRAYTAGANSYLVKPLGFEALVTLVRNIGAAWLAGALPDLALARLSAVPSGGH